ncbi:MAG: protein-L-isoaspartate(D-aspartate) O-methyltransferase [Ignavibacteriaceae bacterium]|nr:protein-L-isoaspartate(D-aspartate) O-methyltransferase [Ignavibacteriaceae bacterium]
MLINKFILISMGVLFFVLNCIPQDDKYSSTRENMVKDQIDNRGIKNQLTLDAMRKVPRHKFVPSNNIDKAYSDGPLPIGYGQTISQPYIVAYMTAVIDPKPGQKVLEIGTGSGYQAAVLAEIVDSVFTIEIITELSNSSQKKLEEIGYKNVFCKNADGYYGWEKYAPFDAIVVTAAAEHIPPPLIKQLKDGGKMIIPVGSPFLNQTLILVEKNGEEITTTSLLPVRFVPFTRGD